MISQTTFPSQLGELIALADDEHLVLLEFSDSALLAKKLEQFANIVD